jgi:hypothetical protein
MPNPFIQLTGAGNRHLIVDQPLTGSGMTFDVCLTQRVRVNDVEAVRGRRCPVMK